MLIDIVFVNERLVGVVREQALGKLSDYLPGMAAGLQFLQYRGVRVPPHGKMGAHVRDEGDKLIVFIDCGLDSRFIHREIEIAGAVFLEQVVPQLRKDGPVSLQRIDIGRGDASPANGPRCPACPRAFDCRCSAAG